MSEGPNRETHTEETPESLAGRLHRLEQNFVLENRWWRGVVLAVIVLFALSVLLGGFHHYPTPSSWECDLFE